MLPLREFLERRLPRLWEQRDKIRDFLGLSSPESETSEDDDRARERARARFWAAVDEGRSEAEEQCSKRDR